MNSVRIGDATRETKQDLSWAKSVGAESQILGMTAEIHTTYAHTIYHTHTCRKSDNIHTPYAHIIYLYTHTCRRSVTGRGYRGRAREMIGQ